MIELNTYDDSYKDRSFMGRCIKTLKGTNQFQIKTHKDRAREREREVLVESEHKREERFIVFEDKCYNKYYY